MNGQPKAIAASLRSAICVDCPADHVWKCIIDFAEWAPTVESVKVISGQPDEEGGVVLVTKREGNRLTPFYSTALKLDPPKQAVHKLDSKDGNQLLGFIDISLVEANGKTQVTYSNYVIYQFETDVPLENLQGEKGAQSVQQGYLRPLKEYAERTWLEAMG